MLMRRDIPKSTLHLLQRSDWDRLWLQGLIWARREAARYGGLGLVRIEREILQTAIEKTLYGEREWKPEVCDLPHHLRMTIRSLYSNELKKLFARQTYAQLERVRPAHAEGAARAQERLDDLRDVLRRLKAAEPELAEFFLEASQRLLQGCDTEGEVAAAMGCLRRSSRNGRRGSRQLSQPSGRSCGRRRRRGNDRSCEANRGQPAWAADT